MAISPAPVIRLATSILWSAQSASDELPREKILALGTDPRSPTNFQIETHMATRPSDANRESARRRTRFFRSAQVPGDDETAAREKASALMKKSRLQHALTDARQPEAATAKGVGDKGAFVVQEQQQTQRNANYDEATEPLMVQSVGLDEQSKQQLEQVYNRVTEPLGSRSPPFASSEDLGLARRATHLTIAKMRATSMDKPMLDQLLTALTAELPLSFAYNKNNSRKTLEKRDVRCWYAFGKLMGKGTFGRVSNAQHRLLSDSQVAIKSYFREPGAAVCCRPPISAARFSRTATSKPYSKCPPGEDTLDWKRVRQEVKMMAALRPHSSIIQFIEAFKTPTQLHVVMEFIKGENLCDHLMRTSSTTLRLSESEARGIFRQVCDAVASLHDQHVIHRDLKLENVLIDMHGHAKLIDFGFSQFDYSSGGSGTTSSGSEAAAAVKNFCGTPSYMAPEVVACASYDGKNADVWSLGVLLYVLLCGRFPFQGQSVHQIRQSVLRVATSALSSPAKGWCFPGGISKDAQSLIRSVLMVDPKKRPRVREILTHAWMTTPVGTGTNTEEEPSRSVHICPHVEDNHQQRFFIAFLNWDEAHMRVCETLEQLYGLDMAELVSALRDKRANGVTAFIRVAVLAAQTKSLQLIDAASTHPKSSEDNNTIRYGMTSSGLNSGEIRKATETHKQHLEKIIGLVKASLAL